MSNLAKWYAVSVYAKFEKKVKQAIEEQASKKGLSDFFEEIFVPSGEVVEIKNGVKVVSETNYLPGYILIKMVANEQTVSLVAGVDKVSGFLPPHKGRADVKPTPVSQSQVDSIRRQAKESVEKSQAMLHFEVGEHVRVSEGPFADFNGVVDEVDNDKQRLKVNVQIFGRETPVDLDFTQVAKAN